MPFVFIAYGYYKTFNPDEKCIGGVIDVLILLVFYGLLFLFGMLALVGIFWKRQGEKLFFEPISFTLALATVFLLGYHLTFRGHTIGDEWIVAQNRDTPGSLSTQTIALRRNGNFTVTLYNADLDCSFSGKYKHSGDTIFLDNKTIGKTDESLTTVYLIRPGKLIPLFDTANKRTFHIVVE